MRALLLLLVGGLLMATYQVTSTGDINNWSWAFHGPVYHGSDIYAAVREPGTKLAVWKSSDSGATWARQDSTNEHSRSSASGLAARNWSMDAFADTMRFYYVSEPGDKLAVADFSMATDTWGSEDESAEAVGTKYGGIIGRRRATDGSDIILYQAPEDGVNGIVKYIIRSGVGSWGTPVQINGIYDDPSSAAVALCLGANDKAYMLFTKQDTDWWSKVYIQTLPYGGAIYTVGGIPYGNTVESSVFFDYDGEGWPIGTPAVINGYLYIPYCRDFVAWVPKLTVAKAVDDSSDAWDMSFVKSDVDVSRTPAYGMFATNDIAIANANGVPWVVFNGWSDKPASWTHPNPIYASRFREDLSPEAWEDVTEVIAPLQQDDSYYAMSAGAKADGSVVGILFSYGTSNVYYSEISISEAVVTTAARYAIR